MANTYQLISSVTVGSGGAANIEFTSIPQTYTDLVVKISSRDTEAGEWNNLDFRMNNLSTNIYSAITVYGTGSSAGVGTETNQAEARRTYEQANTTTANVFSNIKFYFPNYKSNNNKSVSVDYVSENNATAAISGFNSILMASTAAITSLKFYPRNGTFLQYSTAYLYGIKNS